MKNSSTLPEFLPESESCPNFADAVHEQLSCTVDILF